jgi:hypothetical protein
MTHKYKVELTDTFGGEANYSWVKRHSIPVPEMRHDKDYKYVEAQAKRIAKNAVGLNGVRGEWENWGDTYVFRPRGMCQILFVNYDDTN